VTSSPSADRAALAAELERVRADFHHLVAIAADEDWDKPTSGTRWTNEQLLFHMVFGYMIVHRSFSYASSAASPNGSTAASRECSMPVPHHST
jgi:hypothetical protein